MSTELTSQLRAGIERVPAQVPPGLARGAYRRYRRRRLAARAIAAVGTAAVAGIAATVFLSGPDRPDRPGMQTTAYVVSHVTQALNALPAGTILFNRMTHGPDDPYVQDRWSTPYRTRVETFTASGQLVDESGYLFTRTTSQNVDVDYRYKYWFGQTNSYGDGKRPYKTLPPGYTCGPEGPDFITADDPAWLRAEVSCGQLRVAGTGTVDGVTAVKLTGNHGQSIISYWVNPTTYLPVRVAVTLSSGELLTQDDFQWLPPTAANLARLNLPVPPTGFTQVPSNGCIASGTCEP